MAAYFKKTFAAQDDTESIKLQNEEEEIEVGFVDGLFEMYKLRSDIAKARAELMAEGAFYNHKFGTFIFGNHIGYKSSLILILQHATLKCVLKSKYHDLINVSIYDKFIAPKLS